MFPLGSFIHLFSAEKLGLAATVRVPEVALARILLAAPETCSLTVRQAHLIPVATE